MNTLSTTIEYKGAIIKIENGRIFTRAFGTTIQNQNNMHWLWIEIERDNLSDGLKQHLKDNNLI